MITRDLTREQLDAQMKRAADRYQGIEDRRAQLRADDLARMNPEHPAIYRETD